MIATSGFLTALECTKFVFGRRSAPDPTGGAYSISSGPPDGLRDPTSKRKGRWGRGKLEKKGEEGNARDWPPFRKFLDLPLLGNTKSNPNPNTSSFFRSSSAACNFHNPKWPPHLLLCVAQMSSFRTHILISCIFGTRPACEILLRYCTVSF